MRKMSEISECCAITVVNCETIKKFYKIISPFLEDVNLKTLVLFGDIENNYINRL